MAKVERAFFNYATSFYTVFGSGNYKLKGIDNMSKILKNPPKNLTDRELGLWLQNAAGILIFENMRNYAINKIPEGLTIERKKEIIQGIDNAIYGLMMMMDGVTGTLENENYSVRIENKIVLQKNGERILEIDTLESDGMCMGFHGWQENDFGNCKIEIIEE